MKTHKYPVILSRIILKYLHINLYIFHSRKYANYLLTLSDYYTFVRAVIEKLIVKLNKVTLTNENFPRQFM